MEPWLTWNLLCSIFNLCLICLLYDFQKTVGFFVSETEMFLKESFYSSSIIGAQKKRGGIFLSRIYP